MAMNKDKKIDIDIDFTIFDIENGECSGNMLLADGVDVLSQCLSIKRVIYALYYYQFLNNKYTESGSNVFCQFLDKSYKDWLNDIVHVIIKHESDLEIIHNALTKEAHFKSCSVESCNFSDTHCSSHSDNNNNINIDALFSFYSSVYNSMHFYLCHLYEVGLRQKKEENDDDEEIKDDSDSDWQCIDILFLKKRNLFISKRKKLGRFFKRISNESNKFTIKNNKKKSNDNIYKKNKFTYLDLMFDELSKNKKIKKDDLKKLNDFLSDNNYDSDAVVDDLKNLTINENDKISNITNSIQNDLLCKVIKNRFVHKRLKKKYFDTGFTFFYWKKYGEKKDQQKQQQQQQFNFNRNDFGGYTEYELYIKSSKFNSLKEEVLYNEENEVDIEKYNKLMVKAEHLIITNRAKQTTAKGTDFLAPIDCDIKKGAALRLQHMVSMILYTDCSKLCTEFSKTFRRIQENESIASIKKRNSYYYFMSKLLNESILMFGDDGWTEKGALYCGVNNIMVLSGFAVRIRSPTSTTKQIQIAINFADEKGMVLQLNNSNGMAGGKWLRMMDVSWISKYKEEDERIMIAGSWPIQIESVRLREHGKWRNYQKFIKPLFWFNAVLNGGGLDGINSNFDVKDVEILNALIFNSKPLSPYILDTFTMFTLEKKMIVINFECLSRFKIPSVLSNLLFDKYEGDGDRDDADNIICDDIDSSRNLLADTVFNLFPNLTQIIIYCTNPWGSKSYRFSLNGLIDKLLKINKTRNTALQCTLNGIWKDQPWDDGNDRSWLYYSFDRLSSFELKPHLISSSLTETKGGYGQKQDTLIFGVL